MGVGGLDGPYLTVPRLMGQLGLTLATLLATGHAKALCVINSPYVSELTVSEAGVEAVAAGTVRAIRLFVFARAAQC